MSVQEYSQSVAPKPEARKGKGRMSKDELNRIMQGIVQDSETLIDGEISPLRKKAADYYHGEPFGNEEDGRSQIIITEVRDVVHGMIPSLMRIFFGPERVVEFVPRPSGRDANLDGIFKRAAIAAQATDYVQYVFEQQKGFLKTYGVLKDGLIRKLGIFKWWWEPPRTMVKTAEGISHEELVALASRDDVELNEGTFVAHEGGPNEPPTFDVEYTVTLKEGRPCFEALPPEEFLFNRGARDDDEALMLAHRTRKRRGDLIALGYDKDVIEEHGGFDVPLDTNVEAQDRLSTTGANTTPQSDAGEANELVQYIEAYVYLDVDGDGVPELRKICMIGPDHYVVHNEPTDERPFAAFCPIPEPHTILGKSVADLTMDVQLVKSNITRSMLDSLALSIFPRMAFQEQFVSVEDILNTEIGAPIRTRKENAVQPISHPFTGQDAMPVLEYFDSVSENRTGRNKGAMGLDADALQSSTADAVGAAITASQEQTELIARIFAETTLKPLFAGIYRMLVKYKPARTIARLRGSYVMIDAATWDADMDVTVNVALGATMTEKKLSALGAIKATQEALLQMFGPGPENPVTSLAQYRETLARMAELSGYRDVSVFFKPVDPNWAPPPTPPPPPSPEQAIAQAQIQIEQMRTQKDLEIKQAELTLKQQQQEFDQDLAIRKLAIDNTLKRYQIDAQFKAGYTEQQMELDASQDEAALKHAMAVTQMQHDMELARRRHAAEMQAQAHEQQMAEQQQAHEQQMAEQQAAQPAAPQQGTE